VSVDMITVRRPVTVARHPGLVPADVVARRVLRGALIWGVVLGLTVWELVAEFGNAYPTAADRAMLVKTMAQNVGWRALFGPPHELDTVAGYTAAHLIGVFGLVVAVWGLLAGTRLLRGEEDAGRTEVLLAGPTTRRRAAAAEVAGLGIGLLALWMIVAAITVAVGRSGDARFSVSASLFAAVAAVATAAMFLAVGALCSQLAATRRQAVVLAAGVLGVAYLLRLVAYSGSALRWLRWASPLSWVDELQPLTGSRPLLLVPITALIAALVVATITLAGHRDLGASLLPAHDTATARTRRLNNPLGLAWRLNLRTALGWGIGLGVGGLLFGSLTKTSEDVWRNASGGVIGKLGGASGGAAYLGIAFLLVALLIATAAAGQVGATREEEAEGYLDHLLARPVARMGWLAGRFTVSAVVLTGVGALTGVLTWIGAVSTGAHESLATLLAAGVNAAPAGIVVLGIGTLLHALVPRLAVGAAYGVVAWSFLVEVIGASLGASRWLLDTSVLHHIARAPAAQVRWDSVGVLVATGVAAAAAGALAFARRDLAGE
jgi:polyether ionophore transport system permease protein